MARQSREEQARWAGFNYACDIARKHGIDALLTEQKKRGVEGISLAMDTTTKNQVSEQIGRNAIYIAINIGCMVLHDKFGFGPVRLQRFLTEYAELQDSINLELVSHADIDGVLMEESNIDFNQYVPREEIHIK